MRDVILLPCISRRSYACITSTRNGDIRKPIDSGVLCLSVIEYIMLKECVSYTTIEFVEMDRQKNQVKGKIMARPKKLVETEVPESIREILDEHLMDPALDFDRDERSIPHFEFVMDQLKTIIVDGRVDVSLKLDAVRLYVEIVHELYGY